MGISTKSVYTKKEIREVLAPLARSIISQRSILPHANLARKPARKSKTFHRTSGRTFIVGVQGGQGTGKTTLVYWLQRELRKDGHAVESFSLDDFYKSWKERQELARKYPGNPYYQISRGLPGTHRVALLQRTLQKLRAGKKAEIPVFDKSLRHAQGDVLPKTRKVRGRKDIILFEGWCLGLPAITARKLASICRKYRIPLRRLDPDLKHSAVVQRFLRSYQPLWKELDYVVMLKPDSPGLHLEWRWQQEKELRQRTGRGMDKAAVESFVRPYLPFTYACYEKVKANAVLLMDKGHGLYKAIFRH